MTDAKKTLEQQLADAEQKLAQQTQSMELKISRLREKITKQDMRKSKFIGQVLIKWHSESTHFSSEYQRRLQDVLLTDADRELFGFPPLPKTEEQKPMSDANSVNQSMIRNSQSNSSATFQVPEDEEI